MKKILLVSYYWPPAGGIVVRRALSMAKFFPQNGLEPIILCAGGETPWLNLDDSAEVPDVKVVRVDAGDLNTLFSPEKTPIDVQAKTAFRALLRTDYMAEWADRALPYAERLVEEYDIEAILITSPPFSILSIGVGLKERFPHIKFIADIRDLFYSFRTGNPILGLRRVLAIPRAKKCLRLADKVVVVSPGFAESLSKMGIDSEVVPVGFDCTIAEDGEYRRGEDFRIIHAGSFPSTGQTPEFVLVAFDMACQMSKDFRDKARLIFAGVSDEYIASQTPKFAERPNNITALRHLPYVDCLKLERGADVNLLILTIPKQVGGDDVIPGKFFEYVASRRPIFATAQKNSVLASLIENDNLGVVADNSPDAIQLELLRLFEKWQRNELPHGASIETAEKYRSDKMIAKYAQILKGL